MKLTATVVQKDRWLFPYEVHRRRGTFELAVTCHATMQRAERAAKRFTKARAPDQIIATWTGDDNVAEPGPPPPRTIPRRYE